MANRPRNWYEMDYEQQREWETNERRHQAEIDDARYESERAEQAHRDEVRRAESRRRELASERDEYAEENAGLSERLSSAEGFIRARGLWDEFKKAVRS